MAELLTTARPYAEAAFSYAKEQQKLQEWSNALNNLAIIAKDEQLAAFLVNPKHSKANKISIFESVMGSGMTNDVKNFLQVVAENGRLIVLPEVAKLFEQYKAQEEKRVKATVVSASKITVEQQKVLSAALNNKFGAEVDIDYEEDASLISGIKVKVGDWVVDNSAKSQLHKLGAAIVN